MNDAVMPLVVPFVNYEDGTAALEWLVSAFGFTEHTRMLSADGHLNHGELVTPGGGLVMLTSSPSYTSPAHHADACELQRLAYDNPYAIDGVLVFVPDVDAHFQQARYAGAAILSEPEDSPHGRLYRVADLEGHRWMFMQAPS